MVSRLCLLLLAAPAPKIAPLRNYQNSTVNFAAGDAVSAAGNTVQIPITAKIFGDYPLRVLGLNLTVHALNGSPVIAQSVTFTPDLRPLITAWEKDVDDEARLTMGAPAAAPEGRGRGGRGGRGATP